MFTSLEKIRSRKSNGMGSHFQSQHIQASFSPIISQRPPIQKRLLSYVRKHYSNSNYIFWPDLTRCHYSKQKLTWMDENVKFVPKEINPSNFPHARPIEVIMVHMLYLNIFLLFRNKCFYFEKKNASLNLISFFKSIFLTFVY